MNKFSNNSVKVPKSFWIDVKKHLENTKYNQYSCDIIFCQYYSWKYSEEVREQALKQWEQWFKPEDRDNSAWIHANNYHEIRTNAQAAKIRKLMINAVIHGKNKTRIKAMIAGASDIKGIK